MSEELNNLVDDILKEKLKLHYENEELEAQGKLIKELCKEIERLNDIIEKNKVLIKEANDRAYSEFEENVKLGNENSSLRFENRKLHSIIKEVREYANKYNDKIQEDILEILDKVGEE